MTNHTAPERTVAASDMQHLLRRSFAMRAAFYAETFDVLKAEFGRDKALELCMTMTRRMGEKMGSAYAVHGPADLAALKEAFLGGIIEGEALFSPEVIRCDHDALEINFHRCPLKEAWEDQGRNGSELEDLCVIAGAIDGGLFETAGFTFAGETWRQGQQGCCRLKVLPGPSKT